MATEPQKWLFLDFTGQGSDSMKVKIEVSRPGMRAPLTRLTPPFASSSRLFSG